MNDQIGRLTFADELAKGIRHLLSSKAPYGTYNLSGGGEPASWAEIAAEVYALTGHDRNSVTGVTTEEYYRDKEQLAPRPLQSALNLTKIQSTGFMPADWRHSLAEYLKKEEANK